MARARSRPPHLESRSGESRPAPPLTAEELLDRARVTGRSGAIGPTELRRYVERVIRGDRAALGGLTPFVNVNATDVWVAMTNVFGVSATDPAIDPRRTLAAAHAVGERLAQACRAGRRIAFATAAPASLLPLYLGLARESSRHGAVVTDEPDEGPIRVDGRSGRSLRWFDGVAVVTDGQAIHPAPDGEAAREWVFVLPRPALVVADGHFAAAAWESGLEVIVPAGPDRGAFAVHSHRGDRALVLPMRTDRAPSAYRLVSERIGAALNGALSSET